MRVVDGTDSSVLSVPCLLVYDFIVLGAREVGHWGCGLCPFSSPRPPRCYLHWNGLIMAVCLALSVGSGRLNNIAELVNADLAVTHGTLRVSRGLNVATRPQG